MRCGASLSVIGRVRPEVAARTGGGDPDAARWLRALERPTAAGMHRRKVAFRDLPQ